MLSETQLFEQFSDQCIVVGTEQLFDHATALEFLSLCKLHSFTILGIDFFDQIDVETRPSKESADYSAISDETDAIQKSYEAAFQLIRRGFPNGASYASFIVESA